MRMPEFSGEASLYRRGSEYILKRVRNISERQVVPAILCCEKCDPERRWEEDFCWDTCRWCGTSALRISTCEWRCAGLTGGAYLNCIWLC